MKKWTLFILVTAWVSTEGYNTPEHREALKRLGPAPLHRYSFARVREAGCWSTAATLAPLPNFERFFRERPLISDASLAGNRVAWRGAAMRDCRHRGSSLCRSSSGR